jgi:hypothetical protein
LLTAHRASSKPAGTGVLPKNSSVPRSSLQFPRRGVRQASACRNDGDAVMLSPTLAKTPGLLPKRSPRFSTFRRWLVTTGSSVGTTGSSSHAAPQASWLKTEPSANRAEATRTALKTAFSE